MYKRQGDVVTVPHDDALNLGHQFTLEAWFKSDGGGTLFQKGSSFPPAYQIEVRGNSLSLASPSVLGINGFDTLEAADVITTGKWYHVAAVVDRISGNMLIYLNGNKVAEKTIQVNDTLASTEDGFFGRDSNGFGFEGALDNVQIWRVVRTAEQIRNDLQLASV